MSSSARRARPFRPHRLFLTVSLAGGMLVLPTVSAPAADPKPVPPTVQTIEVTGVDAAATEDSAATKGSDAPSGPISRTAGGPPEALTSTRRTDPFTVAGVSWPAGEPVSRVHVRLLEQGTWSAWQMLEVVEGGPDADTEEYTSSSRRIGTAPVVSDGAEGVQVRVDTSDGSAPQGVNVTLIDPGTSAADGTAAGQAEPAATANSVATAPRIVTRAQWGADESLTTGTHRVSETVRALVLHHTAGSNSYTQAQAASQLRGVYAYHTQALGWSDIGYNLVIDRFGTIYEGRRGSISLAIQGAHAGGFNRDTFGVSVLGDFVGVNPPGGVITALNKVIGWKLGQYGAGPRGTSLLTSAGGGTSRYPAGVRVTVNNVMGHRDVGQTSCPGNLQSYLPSLRTAAAPLAARTTANLRGAFPRDFSGDRVADVLAIDATGRLLLYRGDGLGGFTRGAAEIGHGWGNIDLLTQVGDFGGDGANDLVARERTTNQLRVYWGNGRGSFVGSKVIGSGWGEIDTLIGIGDMNRDGRRDLLARRDDGTLWRYYGNGIGGFARGGTTQVGRGFERFDMVGAAGDFTDDGDPDLLARTPDGDLHVYPGTPTGTFEANVHVGVEWQTMRQVIGTGSWDSRIGQDLLARTDGGTLMVYSGDANGGFASSAGLGSGWGTVRLVP